MLEIDKMPILIFVTLIVILYIMVVEPAQKQNRAILYRRLAVATVVGLVLSFGLLVYLVARHTPVEGAYPGSGNLSTTVPIRGDGPRSEAMLVVKRG